MRVTFNIIKWTVTAILMVSVFSHHSVEARSHGEIYAWVVDELDLKEDYPLPAVTIVSRDELRRTYRAYNAKAFKSWSSDYGEQMANQMMDFYLDNVVGLFIPKTGQVLVGDFLASCKREAVVAHEMAHYLQLMKDGQIDPRTHDAADRFLLREMQGSGIENSYVKQYCPEK